jgi:hypothetical protein
MFNPDWLKYGGTILVSLIGGGAMGAVLTNWFTNKRNKIPTIGIQQSISCVFASEISVKPKITFTTEGVEFHFENLYIIETQIQNEGNNDYPDFDLKLTLSPFAKLVYVDCKSQDASHEITLKEKIEFASPSMIADLSLNPFNRKNTFHITGYATCEDNKGLTKKDIKYSSKISANFKAVEAITKPILYQ